MKIYYETGCFSVSGFISFLRKCPEQVNFYPLCKAVDKTTADLALRTWRKQNCVLYTDYSGALTDRNSKNKYGVHEIFIRDEDNEWVPIQNIPKEKISVLSVSEKILRLLEMEERSKIVQ